MFPIRLVTALTLLAVASTAAHGTPPAVAGDATGPAGDPRLLPKVELSLTPADYRIEDHQTQLLGRFPAADGTLSGGRPATPATPALNRLLPQSIDDRTVGYRIWF